MDMHLPRLSGLETIAIVRQIKGVIPVILITADQDDNLLRQALSAHAFCVLAKPVSKHVVIYVVTRRSRSTTTDPLPCKRTGPSMTAPKRSRSWCGLFLVLAVSSMASARWPMTSRTSGSIARSR